MTRRTSPWGSTLITVPHPTSTAADAVRQIHLPKSEQRSASLAFVAIGMTVLSGYMTVLVCIDRLFPMTQFPALFPAIYAAAGLVTRICILLFPRLDAFRLGVSALVAQMVITPLIAICTFYPPAWGVKLALVLSGFLGVAVGCAEAGFFALSAILPVNFSVACGFGLGLSGLVLWVISFFCGMVFYRSIFLHVVFIASWIIQVHGLFAVRGLFMQSWARLSLVEYRLSSSRDHKDDIAGMITVDETETGNQESALAEVTALLKSPRMAKMAAPKTMTVIGDIWDVVLANFLASVGTFICFPALTIKLAPRGGDIIVLGAFQIFDMIGRIMCMMEIHMPRNTLLPAGVGMAIAFPLVFRSILFSGIESVAIAVPMVAGLATINGWVFASAMHHGPRIARDAQDKAAVLCAMSYSIGIAVGSATLNCLIAIGFFPADAGVSKSLASVTRGGRVAYYEADTDSLGRSHGTHRRTVGTPPVRSAPEVLASTTPTPTTTPTAPPPSTPTPTPTSS